MSKYVLQIPMERHATTRESPVKRVCYAATINCRCESKRVATQRLCMELVSDFCPFHWVLTGYSSYPGGRVSRQRRPVSNHSGNDQERMASKLARYAKRDGSSHQPGGE